MTVTLSNGRLINAEVVVCSEQFDLIQIYTNDVSMTEACSLFEKSEFLSPLLITDDDGSEKSYENYTELYSVQKSRLVHGDNMIMIWLQRPNKKEDKMDQFMSSLINRIKH